MMKVSEGETSARGRLAAARPQEPARSSGTAASDASAGRVSGWHWVFGFVLSLGILLIVLVWSGVFDRGPRGNDSPTLRGIPSDYDSDRAMRYLVQLCDLGPRPSGSPAMTRQQQMLQEFFTQRGATVTMQRFEIRHPEDGSPVPMANLIATWHPTRAKRFLLCAHYDTRPFPDRDRTNRRGTFIGANDGGSGTAALMELANQLADLPPDVGVDMVLFDGEEFVWEQGRDDYFLGSKFFAEKYLATPPAVPYRCGILLDMVGDRELKIYYEENSLKYARDVAKSIWKTAGRLGVRAFVPRSRHKIDDDHIPLNQVAKIPTVDLIDFDYPRPGIGAPSYWHTEQDTAENCSGESLAAVVWVVHEWLKSQ